MGLKSPEYTITKGDTLKKYKKSVKSAESSCVSEHNEQSQI